MSSKLDEWSAVIRVVFWWRIDVVEVIDGVGVDLRKSSRPGELREVGDAICECDMQAA